jgi:hypothetical protein
MKNSNAWTKGKRQQTIASRPTRDCVICHEPFIYSRHDQITCAKEDCLWQRKLKTLREFHERNREKQNKKQHERYATLVALAKQAKQAKQVLAAKKIGRPPNAQLKQRVRELRATATSWTRVKMILDRETGMKRALSTYRDYAENP